MKEENNEKIGGSFVKLELFKVDITNDNEIKDFSSFLSSTAEKTEPKEIISKPNIKSEVFQDDTISELKRENEFQEAYIKSIQTENPAFDKVTVDAFFVDRDVFSKLVKEENNFQPEHNLDVLDSITNNSIDHFPTLKTEENAYDVVLNVLNDIVSSISE